MLGTELLPQYEGLARVNMYACAFSFEDGDELGQPQHVKALSTYDYVILESEFTDKWVVGRAVAAWPCWAGQGQHGLADHVHA